jgi:YfiH family protein
VTAPHPDWIVPDWPAPPNVRALVTTRAGGESRGAYTSFNLGTHVGDDPAAVERNRARLRASLPAEPVWLQQVHGTAVIDAASALPPVRADAAVARVRRVVCAVLTADCVPVLLAASGGEVVAIAHAGWRGLAAGVVEAALAAMGVPAASIVAWLGPAIGPRVYEVGPEVRAAFVRHDAAAAAAFAPHRGDRLLADLAMLARQRLAAAGVAQVCGGGHCTYTEAERFYSYRRAPATGRFASLVWLD